jgi:hypothetical protein
MDVKRLAVFATVCPDQGWLKYLTRHMLTVLTRPAPISFTQSRLVRTSLCLAPMSLMPLPKPRHQNRVSMSDWTRHFMTGGSTTKVDPLFLQAMLFLPYRQCRAIQNQRLWEKHADAILRNLGLTPTTHELCLYSGTIAGRRVIFKRQVDDFAIAAPDEKTADILPDILNNQLSIPLKRQGLLDMLNGINVTQTQDYIKIDCHIYIDKFCQKYINSWLYKFPMTENRPTPLPTDATWIKKFNAPVGPSDPKQQQQLATKMEIKYKGGIGELIWAMTTCRPDISFTSVKLSQSNLAPTEHHYHGLKHAILYVYFT